MANKFSIRRSSCYECIPCLLFYSLSLSLFSLFPFLKNMKNYQSKGNKIFFKKITFKTLSLQFNLQLFWEIQDSCTETLACLYHMLVIYTYLLEWNFFFLSLLVMQAWWCFFIYYLLLHLEEEKKQNKRQAKYFIIS